MMITWPFKEIFNASLADFCKSRGYGNVTIYISLITRENGDFIDLTSLGLIVALEA